MGFLNNMFGSAETSMQEGWKVLNDAAQLKEIKKRSFERPVVIFKHSVTCGISAHAKHKLESAWDFADEDLEFYYLDLLSYRPVSNLVADTFNVIHQSPQLLVIKNGEAIYDTSHQMVSVDAIKGAL